jgi:hypothetical protein
MVVEDLPIFAVKNISLKVVLMVETEVEAVT